MARSRQGPSVTGMSTAALQAGPPLELRSGRSLARRAWVWLSGLAAAVLGVLPHILHHAGPLAGAALFAGATGSLLFGAIGFAAAIPFLRRVRRHCGNWRVPAGILAAMAIVFSLSTFVIGPAIAGGGDDDGDDANTPVQPAPAGERPSGHDGHH